MEMKRVFLKLSGEALAGSKKTGFDEATVREVAKQVKISVDAGVQVGIVIGGGNFWRGRNSSKIIERTKSDQIGMLATIMNGQALQDTLELRGLDTRLQSAIEMRQIAEVVPYLSEISLNRLIVAESLKNGN